MLWTRLDTNPSVKKKKEGGEERMMHHTQSVQKMESAFADHPCDANTAHLNLWIYCSVPAKLRENVFSKVTSIDLDNLKWSSVCLWLKVGGKKMCQHCYYTGKLLQLCIQASLKIDVFLLLYWQFTFILWLSGENWRSWYCVYSALERRNEYEASVSSFIVKWSHLMVETCHCIYIYKKDPRYRLRHSTANTYIIIIIK